MTDRGRLAAALAQVPDPELGVDIVSLGLVYDLRREGDRVEVRLSMTSAACPLAGWIMDEAQQYLRYAAPGAREIDVDLVWEPPWSPEMMSDDAREALEY